MISWGFNITPVPPSAVGILAIPALVASGLVVAGTASPDCLAGPPSGVGAVGVGLGIPNKLLIASWNAYDIAENIAFIGDPPEAKACWYASLALWGPFLYCAVTASLGPVCGDANPTTGNPVRADLICLANSIRSTTFLSTSAGRSYFLANCSAAVSNDVSLLYINWLSSL